MTRLRAILCLSLVFLAFATGVSVLTYCSRGYNATLCERTAFKASETGDIMLCAAQGTNYNPRGWYHA